jgi:chorismate dehydratase
VIRCGRISYTNDLPIYAAFDAGAVEFPGLLSAGVPTVLNARLSAGDLDISPISSFHFAKNAQAFLLFPDVCIGARRDVRSIYCVSRKPPADLAGVAIATTRESATGRNLFATICAERYGFTPDYVESDDPLAAYRADGAPCLLIGDAAIDGFFAAEPGDAHDIGSLWHELTGLGMAYAVWAVRRDVATDRPSEVEAVATALRRAKTWGADNIDDVIAAARSVRPRPEGFYRDYYATLNFDFDEAARLGLTRFFELAVKHGLLGSVPRFEFLREVPTHV